MSEKLGLMHINATIQSARNNVLNNVLQQERGNGKATIMIDNNASKKLWATEKGALAHD